MPESIEDVVEDGIEGCCCRTGARGAFTCGLCVIGEHVECRDTRTKARRAR